MKTLITGSSGFLGSYFLKALEGSDFFSLNVNGTVPNSKIVDISKNIPDLNGFSFDKVIHNAGLAHRVPKSEAEGELFYQVNFEGTKNLLKGLESLDKLPSYFIFISTVAVYGLDKAENIVENQPLNSKEPYGISKIKAEKVVEDFCKKNNIHYLILRLPLMVGKNPPGNLGKMINGIKTSRYARIGNGSSKKSMLYAKDLADFVIKYSGKTSGIYNLTDGYHPTFTEIENEIGKCVNKSIIKVPIFIANILANVGTVISNTIWKSFPFNKRTFSKMTNSLYFSDEKARKELNWNPTPVLSIINEIV